MNIIFLDIDGVLNSYNGTIKRQGVSIMDLYYEHIDVLKWVLDVTDARLVISSTWRLNKSVEELRLLFYNYGLNPQYIIDKTPRVTTKGSIRGDEIKLWLDNTELEMDKFVILDDDSDMTPFMANLVQTSFDYGLTYVEALKVIEMLTGKTLRNVKSENKDALATSLELKL